MGVMEGHTVEEIKEKFQDVRFLPFSAFWSFASCSNVLLLNPLFFSQCPDLRSRHPRQLEDLAHHPGYQFQTHANPV